MKTKIITLQFAFFLRDIVSRPDIEFGDLNQAMLNIFDGMPQIIPIPKELPPEIPVMVLRSNNNEYTCNISRSRIDFILNRIDDDKSNSALLQDFNAKISGITKAILDKQEVTRFGMVARYFHQDNMATRTIRNKFFTSTVDGTHELSLRFNKKSNAFGYGINDILEISAADIVNKGALTKGILIQRDINNAPIHGKDLDFSTLSNLSKKYATKISESEIEGLIK
ncbi:MAG: hypothetical protein RPS47_17470 [Colwellia sp.]